jgi:hypothetical protein
VRKTQVTGVEEDQQGIAASNDAGSLSIRVQTTNLEAQLNIALSQKLDSDSQTELVHQNIKNLLIKQSINNVKK